MTAAHSAAHLAVFSKFKRPSSVQEEGLVGRNEENKLLLDEGPFKYLVPDKKSNDFLTKKQTESKIE